MDMYRLSTEFVYLKQDMTKFKGFCVPAQDVLR